MEHPGGGQQQSWPSGGSSQHGRQVAAAKGNTTSNVSRKLPNVSRKLPIHKEMCVVSFKRNWSLCCGGLWVASAGEHLEREWWTMALESIVHHHPSDASLAAWAARILNIALGSDGGRITAVPLGGEGRALRQANGGRPVMWLSWRRTLAHAVYWLQRQGSLPLGTNTTAATLPDTLRTALEAVEAHDARIGGKGQVLYVDDLVEAFSPTLRVWLAAVGADPAASPLASSTLTADALALLDQYAAQAELARAVVTKSSLPTGRTGSGESASEAAAAAVAATMRMDEYYTIKKALGGSPALGGDALLARLEAAGNHSRHSRRDKRQALAQQIMASWRVPRRADSSRRAGGSAAGEGGNPVSGWMTSHAIAAVRAPLCDLLPTWPAACSAFLGTPYEAGFGEVASNGCRCPPRAAGGGSPAALMVGTHHKTGTVLMEMLLLELAKLVDSDGIHKPRWSDCKGKAADSKPPPPPRASNAASEYGPLRHRALCVDEHVRALPPEPWSGAPFVHVVRDPLEVCISSYQYALRANESWLRVPNPSLGGLSYQAFYRQSPVHLGLGTECRRCFKELRQTAQLYEASAHQPTTLTIRFEDLERRFEPTVRRLFTFAGAAGNGEPRAKARFEALVTAALKHDVSRRGSPAAAAKEVAHPIRTRTQALHVSNSSEKGALRALLLDPSLGVSAELRRLRLKLGYAPAAGNTADGDGAEARHRRWVLATAATTRA